MISYLLDEEARYVATKIILFTTVVMMITTSAWHTFSNGGNYSGGMTLAALIIGFLVAIPTALTSVLCMSLERSATVPSGLALIISYALTTAAITAATTGAITMTGNDLIYAGVTAVAVSGFTKYCQSRI